MPAASLLVGWRGIEPLETWIPKTLADLNKPEEFLEQVVCEHPELLQLESRRSGIRGPFCVFRQVAFATPLGRSICADIVLLAASGHVIVVEAKRHSNPELRDRAVIAQIIDYASSFSALTAQQLCSMFSTKDSTAATWSDLVLRLFPDERDGEELAELLLGRFSSGELNLVLVCDRVPPGLPELIAGIASQKTLGFDLDLVEITPFVKFGAGDTTILLVPTTRLSTEIVARTAITITYRAGDPQPQTEVQTTPLEEIEERVREAKTSSRSGKIWTAAEIEEETRRLGEPIAVELLEFCKQNSDKGQFFAPGRRVSATYGLYLKRKRGDGTDLKRCVLGCTIDAARRAYVYINFVEDLIGKEIAEQFRQRLKAMFGDDFNAELTGSSIPLRAVERNWTVFRDALLWLKSEVESHAG